MTDTAGQYHPFFDMCGYCEMDTGGQHQPNCPLFQPFPSLLLPEVSMVVSIEFLGGNDGKNS